MTLTDVKKQVLALIEELNPQSTYLTDDPDIQAKIDYVIDQIQMELARIKKIPKNIELEVDLEEKSKYTLDDLGLYQINVIRGLKHEIIEDTIIFEENGTADIYGYELPPLVTEFEPETESDEYEFILDKECMEILPYGVAGDLLKSDISANYGQIYANRYENMLQRLDPRFSTGSIYIGGEDYGI